MQNIDHHRIAERAGVLIRMRTTGGADDEISRTIEGETGLVHPQSVLGLGGLKLYRMNDMKNAVGYEGLAFFDELRNVHSGMTTAAIRWQSSSRL